jgi:hypothetical protein
MNPRKLWEFLTSKFGLFLVFLAVLFTGLWIYGSRQAEAKRVAKLSAQPGKQVKLGQVRVPLEKGLENGLPQQVEARSVSAEDGPASDGKLVPFRPPTTPVNSTAAPAASAPQPVAEKKAPEKPKWVHHASLLAAYTPLEPLPNPPAAPPERFVPYGTLMKCKLVNTVDSANIETPVIAILLEDIWQNCQRVIPANTLVHGTARAGRIRDRINASGTWRFVWQDGRELSFTGVALDREYDQDIEGYGITDGSAGLKGRLIMTDDYQELKMLASAALSGFARGTQDRTQTALGTTITGSVSSGVREGVANVFDVYAQRTLRDIEENGYYVRVPAGKEFYVYVLETVNPDKAKIAGAVASGTSGVHQDVTQPAETVPPRPVKGAETKG